jgi:hypothetical protein
MTPMNPTTSGLSVFRTESFDCECFSYDHSIRFAFDPTEEDIRCQEIWVDCHFPCNRSLWQRIVLAAKYILKIGPQDYSYGSWILKHEDEARLRKFFLEYEAAVMNLENKARENAPKPTDSL